MFQPMGRLNFKRQLRSVQWEEAETGAAPAAALSSSDLLDYLLLFRFFNGF